MSRRGFTLLEMVVAIVIFTIVVSAAYALFESGRSVSLRGERRARLFQTARAVLAMIEADLRGAVLPGEDILTEFTGTDNADGDLPVDEIETLAINLDGLVTEEPQSDRSIVRYWIDSERGLLRERDGVLSPPVVDIEREEEEEDYEEVSADVIGLNLRYFDEGTWHDVWESEQERKLPQAVEVTIHVSDTWRGEELVETFTLRFHLTVGAETPEREE